jgi:hypothetical protein
MEKKNPTRSWHMLRENRKVNPTTVKKGNEGTR